ncbi:MAG: PAS domain S-box protein [Rhizobiales bacterium]|nr:PAS domain S-box protein [Hyphomicrobiales bacterium]
MPTKQKNRAREKLEGAVQRVHARKSPEIVEDKAGRRVAVVPLEGLELIYNLKSDGSAQRLADHPKSAALVEETERLAQLGYWEWDEVADKCLYCSPELARLHGVTVERYVKESKSTEADGLWVHPDDRQRYEQACRDFKLDPVRFSIEFRLQNPDGHIRFVKETVHPVVDADGGLVTSFGFVQDLTKWYSKERELESTAKLLRQAAELADIGYWIWDEVEDRCVFCSDTLAAMFNVTVEEYLERFSTIDNLLAGIHPEDQERYLEVNRQAAINKQPFEIYYRDRAADGTYRYLRERGTPIVDESGNLVRSIGILQDMTKDKALEHALERQVERRTAELRQANEALETSQARLMAFFKFSPAEIGIKDLEGRYVMVNPMTEKVHQSPAEEIIGRTPHDFFPKDLADALVEHDRIVLETGQPLAREVSGFVDGEHRSYLATKFAIRDALDEPIGLGAVAVEITEQKRAEQALKSSEQRYRELFEQCPSPIFEENWSAIKRIVDDLVQDGVNDLQQHLHDNQDVLDRLYDLADCFKINPAAVQLYQATGVDELQDCLDHTMATESVLANYAAAIAAFHQGHSSYECEMDELTLTNMPITTKISFHLPDSYRHDWSRVLLTVTDISARKLMEDELRRSEERYRELFDDSPAAIWEEDWTPIRRMLEDLAQRGVEDLRGYFTGNRDQLKAAYDAAIVLEISQAAIDLYREDTKEQILRCSTSQTVIDEELDAFLDILLAFWSGQQEIDIESRDSTGDGEGIIVRRRVAIPARYQDDWSRVIYVIEDITERTQLENHLRQAQKMEAVGQLTGGIAHDFNNLLAIIQGNAEMLVRANGNGQPLADAILRAAMRGAELTQHLLAYARQQPLAPQVIDVALLVTELWELLERTLGEGIVVDISLEAGIWPALADPGQLENAVLNLALNARDAMPDGGALKIKCMNLALASGGLPENPGIKAGNYVVLMVSDAGCGMTDDVLEHAFEPFFTTKDVGEGTGLGLSMVYGFAKQTGGHVTIDSCPGEGTTVKLYLPHAHDMVVSEAMAERESMPRGHGETVLVIEDDPDVRSLASRMLEDLDYRTIEAPDAARAQETLADGALVDVVLSDIVLPGGTSGPDFAKQARAAQPDIKIIFMSGYSGMAAKRDDLSRANCVLLNKPFKARQLAEALQEVLA